MSAETYRYRAFISYRHVERDRKWARWLIEKLETYRTPQALVRAGAPARIGHLYRDDDEVPASSDLSHEIENSLRASQFLIVVCSPDTPESKWVRREIAFFRSLGRGDRILALLVDGEPGESFPADLLRVAVETRAPDGSLKTEWVEREPIASDVRPRSDERRSVTERRAFLRIAAGLLGVGYDDLVQREQTRRRRTGRLWAAVAATLVLALAAGLYSYWDYAATHERHFADVVLRWAVPEGVHPISAEEASHRRISYLVSTRFGRVVEVRTVNGSGTLTSQPDNDFLSDPDDIGSADLKISYEGDRVGNIDEYATNGRLLRSESYRFMEDKHSPGKLIAVESFHRPSGGAQAMWSENINSGYYGTGADVSAMTGKSAITQHLLHFSDAGYEVKSEFQTAWGASSDDGTGIAGTLSSYDSHGLLTDMTSIDRNGQRIGGKDGLSELKMHYDENGQPREMDIYDVSGALRAIATIQRDAHDNTQEEEYRNARGALAISASGFARKVVTYDDRGNVTTTRIFGTRDEALPDENGVFQIHTTFDGKGNPVEARYDDDHDAPMLAKNGFARMRAEFDAEGNPTQEAGYGLDGKPSQGTNGCTVVRFKYDDEGYLTDERCLDGSGKPSISSDGTARVHHTYEDGNETERSFSGLHDEPILSKDGFARYAAKYNEQGDVVESAWYGVKGEPVFNHAGFCRLVNTFDERGNLSRMDSYGPDGARAFVPAGAQSVEWKYDDHGNRTEARYLVGESQPTIGADGTAGQRVTYDGRGHPKEAENLDTTGAVAPNPQGIARVLTQFDDSGNLTETKYLGADNSPVAGPKGWSTMRQTFNELGEVLTELYFDTNGAPVQSDQGSFGVRYEYDPRGKATSDIYLAADGRSPLVGKAGVARIARRFDNRGNEIEERYYNAGGRPANITLGYAILLLQYDDRNRETKRTTLDASRRRVASKDGYAEMRELYNDRGDRIESDYFDVDGELMGSNAVAKMATRYDARDNPAAVAFYDRSNNLINSSGGYAIENKAYNDRDQLIREAFFGPDGRPILLPQGFSAETYRYDPRGRFVEGAYFTLNGPPASGVARWTVDYDAYGRVTAHRNFDANGVELPQANPQAAKP